MCRKCLGRGLEYARGEAVNYCNCPFGLNAWRAAGRVPFEQSIYAPGNTPSPTQPTAVTWVVPEPPPAPYRPRYTRSTRVLSPRGELYNLTVDEAAQAVEEMDLRPSPEFLERIRGLMHDPTTTISYFGEPITVSTEAPTAVSQAAEAAF